MPVSMQLALGTLKLEETGLAVTSEQAEILLPLWKAARALSQSDNVAGEELDAVFNQIQEAMTSEQLEVIKEMELTMQDMQALFPEMRGVGFNMDEDMQATREAIRESGQPPEGFVPGEGQGGQDIPPEGFPGGGPPQDGSEQQNRNGRFNTLFFDSVIELLEEK
jgi:hypothetical protein